MKSFIAVRMTLKDPDNDEDDNKEDEEEDLSSSIDVASKKSVKPSVMFQDHKIIPMRHDVYQQAIKNLSRNLYITHPTCRQVLALSQSTLGSVLLLDTLSFRWDVVSFFRWGCCLFHQKGNSVGCLEGGEGW